MMVIDLSLYGDYIKEREGKEIIESDDGFATYTFMGEFCYIVDIYVVPGKRKTKVASTMADQIAKLAKEKGFKFLLGSVDPSTNGATESMKALLSYGFRVHSMDQRLIYLTKEI